MKRRAFIVGAAFLGIDLTAPEAFAAAPGAAETMLSILGDRKAAAAFGAVWLVQGTRQPDAVLAALQARLRKLGWMGEAEADHLRGLFNAAVADDYRTGSMVTVDGWLVAESQAELCALAYFDRENRL